MSPSAAEKSGEFSKSVSRDPDLDIGLVGKPLCRRAIHADGGQHAAGEGVHSVHPHRGVGELHHRRLEVGGVVVGAGLVGGLLEAVDQAVGGVEPSGRRADRAQVVLPLRARRTGEHRRGDRGQLRVGVRRQRLRAQDQVGVGRLDRLQVRLAARARRRARRAPRCPDMRAGCRSRRAVRPRRCATAAPARTARRVGHPTARRCAAGRPRTVVVPAAWRTSRSGGPGSSAAGSGAHDSSGLR